MSVHVSVWAWDQTTGSPLSKLILVALADQTNDDGWMRWPPAHSVTRGLEASRTTYDKHIRKLIADGFMVVVERPDNPISRLWARLLVPWDSGNGDQP